METLNEDSKNVKSRRKPAAMCLVYMVGKGQRWLKL